MPESKRAKSIPGGFSVLGVQLEGFVNPSCQEVVFSRRGLSRSLDVPRTSLARILDSDDFKTLCGKTSDWPKMPTDRGSRSITVLTQSELSVLIRVLAEQVDSRGQAKYPKPKSMWDAGFPIVLQQSVDEALEISREQREYLEAGATLRQRLEYRYSYHQMKDSTFEGSYGVRGLCRINRQVSSLAVPDADWRRVKNKAWRRNCSGIETTKITIANTVHQKAVEASSKGTLDKNLGVAAERTSNIFQIMDAPF